MAENDRPVSFRGDLDECFKHLVELFDKTHPKGSKGAALARKPMADFCNVELSTVARWMQGHSGLPKGEIWFKLAFFLNLHGYEVRELEGMDQSLRNFAELLAFGVFSGDELAEKLGYTETSAVYSTLYGVNTPTQAKQNLMWNLWKDKDNRAKVEEAKRKARENNMFPFIRVPSSDATPPATDEAVVSVDSSPAPVTHEHEGDPILDLMSGLLKLLDRRKADGESLQIQNGEVQMVLRLSGHLSELSAGIVARRVKG